MYGFIIHKELFASEKHKRSVIAALRGFWSLLEKVPDQQDDEPGSPGEGGQDDVTDDGEDAYVLHDDSFLCGFHYTPGKYRGRSGGPDLSSELVGIDDYNSNVVAQLAKHLPES